MRFREAFADREEMIAVDETCVYLNDHPRYGYSLRGTRLTHRKKQPKRSCKMSLLLAISSCRGVVGHNCINGSFNTASFTDFIHTLDAPRGATVIMDNARFHHSRSVKDRATSRGFRLLYTPPYSPDFNPIETAFSVLKAAMRKGSPVSLAEALQTLTQPKCKAFFDGTSRFLGGPSAMGA